VKEPLLMIHGFTDTGRTWTPVIPFLEPHHELLMPTLTGHCGGPPVAQDMKDPMAAMADALETVLYDAGHEKAHVAGNSSPATRSVGGSRSRWCAAAVHSASWRSRRPWAGSPTSRLGTRRQFEMAHRFGRPAAKQAEFLAAAGAARARLPRPHRSSGATEAGYGLDLIVGNAECTMFDAYLAHVEAGDYRANWDANLGVPTRIAWSMRDRTPPYRTCSSWYRQALPDAEWVELPDCGHLAQHDDSELVARTILEVTTAGALAAVTEVL
jgi:pimeloyl-ACP methyl ester carboxylesterase